MQTTPPAGTALFCAGNAATRENCAKAAVLDTETIDTRVARATRTIRQAIQNITIAAGKRKRAERENLTSVNLGPTKRA